MRVIVRLKGGPGSGHHGHRGRPGHVGGSATGGGGVLRFGNIDAADAWARNVASLNPEVSNAQNDALEGYKGENYLDVNDDLRHGGYSEMYDADISAIDEVMDRGRVPEDVVVYRGSDYDVFEDYDDLTGDIISDDAYVSTSLARSVAEAHSEGMVMEIRVPAGANALYMDRWKVSGWRSESEILLPRGSRFKVVEDVHDPDEYTRRMVLELVL